MFLNRHQLLHCLVMMASISTLWTSWGWSQGNLAGSSNSIGRQVADFSLKDFRGKTHRLSDYDQDVLVLIVSGVECPLAKLYAERINNLEKMLQGQSVQFLTLNANSQDSITEMAAFARRQNVEHPMLKDVGNVIADQLGAERTPEVFVLDKQRVIRYTGRIDDQYGVGYIRPKPTRSDLLEAVRELLAGKTVSVEHTKASGCLIGKVRQPVASSTVTYARDVSRLLQKHCISCHREGEIAPFSLTEYEEVAGWAEMILEVVDDRRMPPWHADPAHGNFANERRLTEAEKDILRQWVEAGAPEGDRRDLPTAVEYADTWALPKKPDAVFYMKNEFDVPAEGAVDYRYSVAKTNFEEDKWVTAFELQPGNRAVVHHILAFLRVGDRFEDMGGGVNGYVAAFVPGLRPQVYPEGMAKRIPAGAELIFQIHYTPIGTPQKDRCRIGMVFADPDSVKYEVKTRSAVTTRLSIPPGESREYRASREIKADSLLLSMMPHMHLRGKSFRYQLKRDNELLTLLDVPAYDFNWQSSYRLAEPMPLKSGDLMQCQAVFDNTEENLSNPDSSRRVRWGEQTWDEMMIGYFDVAEPLQPADSPSLRDAISNTVRSLALRRNAKQFIKRFDKNGDEQLSLDELPTRMRGQFNIADRNDDDQVDVEELTAFFNRR